MHTFFDEDADGAEILEELTEKYSGKKIFIGNIPDWKLKVVADEPITPQKVLKWWNQGLDPESEDYRAEAPRIEV